MKRPHPSLDWSAIHWPDFAGVDLSCWIAVLPLAAIEQHGPHLPLGTDLLIAQAYLSEVRKNLGTDVPATFLPVQSIGISTEHQNFRGTLTLPPAVALQSWIAIGESVARTGLRKLVIVTSHGGNSAAMTMAAQELRARHNMLVVTTAWSRLSQAERLFDPDEVKFGIHGGATETSLMLARYAEQVRMDEVANFRPSHLSAPDGFKQLSTQRPAPLAWQAEDLHPAGAVGDATQATAALGEELLRNGARAFAELLGDVRDFDLARLRSGPD